MSKPEKPEPKTGKRTVSQVSFVERRTTTIIGRFTQVTTVTVAHCSAKPSSPPKKKKRIVSKGEYLTRILKKVALRLGSVGLLGGGGFVFVLAVCCLCIGMLLWSDSVLISLLWLLGFVLVLALAFGTFHVSNKYKERARQIDVGVPLTRANTADLSAPDSLVRASAEPVQEQEAVLLRAAKQGRETPVEQLVRPIGGQE